MFPGERTTKGGKPWKEPVDYNGARSTAAIASAGLAQLTDKHVQVVSKAADLAKVLEANKGKTAVLFRFVYFFFLLFFVVMSVQCQGAAGELVQSALDAAEAARP